MRSRRHRTKIVDVGSGLKFLKSLFALSGPTEEKPKRGTDHNAL
jgi:hypothetical protein